MKAIVETDYDPPQPLVMEDVKPRLFSIAWFVTMFSALNFAKYTARDWGIYNLSSACTYGTIFGIYKPVATYVAAHFPWLVSGVKLMITWITACAVAFLKLVTHTV